MLLNKQRDKPLKWRAVFAESALIGASILLAFALQDWDEERDIEERTLIALCNVKSELSFNQILLKNDYIPRQQGMLASVKGTISLLQAQPDGRPPKTDLESMLIQESLRYSAWTLAGESGYLLHANFELATEIGALIDFQQDSYLSVVNRINEAVFDRGTQYREAPLDWYVSLSSLINEWVTQTDFLERKYVALFERSDFIELGCRE
ncbi:hypothetical protein [Aestuariibacter salexigens]|uniref:hypothetical protein n=1 Tax=Aestuariibacter salexigens TaxID=226010 RepID=UPI000403F4B0|nr:hypothetical protein [Aestuariibacter salexigens]